MKLVEILARELAEWPEGFEEIQQRGVDLYFYEACGAYTLGISDFSIATDHATAIVTREMWEAERAKLASPAEWDGEGLPPVGLPFELRMTSGVWITATPTAYGKKHMLFEDKSGKERIEYIS